MSFLKKNRIVVITAVYWVLLVYIVAALLWWFIALNHQNNILTELRLKSLNTNDPHYVIQEGAIVAAQKRKTAQYIGEGAIFFLLIAIGAVFVYRATRRQLKLAKQQQNFMMAVTHELKTPIAVTLLNLETLLKRKLDIEKQERLIGNTIHEANRLNALCNNILLAAQLDGGIYQSEKESIPLSDMLENSTQNFKTRFPQRQLLTKISPAVYIQGQELLLQMLINNLIDNALKYSPKESTITITLKHTNTKVELQVTDEGIGIAAIEKKKIFDKFYRVGDENTRKTKGSGLGLFLCKKIMQDHSGQIIITDNHPSGSIFTAIFSI